MKKFDLEAAKNGAPVITIDGKSARIVCFDMKGEYSLLALIDEKRVERCGFYYKDGSSNEFPKLFMAPVKNKGFINIYPCLEDNSIVAATSHMFRTRQDADNQNGSKSRIACVEIEWDE